MTSGATRAKEEKHHQQLMVLLLWNTSLIPSRQGHANIVETGLRFAVPLLNVFLE